MMVFDEKIFEISCSMPPGIVHNHEYRSFGLREEKTDKTAECIGIERGSFLCHEAAWV